MSFLVPSQRGVSQQAPPPSPPIHNQPPRSHLPLSSLPGYPHQDMPSPSSMSSSFAPDSTAHTTPKIGETRCCESSIFIFVRYFHIQFLPLFAGRTSDHLVLSPFHSFGPVFTNPLLPFRLVVVIVRFTLHLPRPRPHMPSRRSGRAPHRKVPPQLCPSRGAGLRQGRPHRGPRTTDNAWHCNKVRVCPV